ncbi:MAG: biopolymer transporter ExbD [Desulfobulbaceae bacterium]|nr:biopolymer transporter ExbD [Desulfobulbaceae bacterium]
MEEKGFDSINVIPLVDVMLVLLTIVLTTSTFIAVGAIPVELPKAENSSSQTLKATTIEINRRGDLYLNAEVCSVDHIRTTLRQLQRTQPILIRADKDIALQSFVDVMDIVKGLGFTKVSLQTKSSM